MLQPQRERIRCHRMPDSAIIASVPPPRGMSSRATSKAVPRERTPARAARKRTPNTFVPNRRGTREQLEIENPNTAERFRHSMRSGTNRIDEVAHAAAKLQRRCDERQIVLKKRPRNPVERDEPRENPSEKPCRRERGQRAGQQGERLRW
jgi:hypothetical protein